MPFRIPIILEPSDKSLLEKHLNILEIPDSFYDILFGVFKPEDFWDKSKYVPFHAVGWKSICSKANIDMRYMLCVHSKSDAEYFNKLSTYKKIIFRIRALKTGDFSGIKDNWQSTTRFQSDFNLLNKWISPKHPTEYSHYFESDGKEIVDYVATGGFASDVQNLCNLVEILKLDGEERLRLSFHPNWW